MELGLHVANFTWPGGTNTLAKDLTTIVQRAEDVGFQRISVMDHVWQIGAVGPTENAMLEAYTALGYIAAQTKRVQLLAWVTAVVYREPGLLAKAVTTLDVLSEGRACLGLTFPPTAERFERLEEALQICLQMWSEDESVYDGKHYQLGRTLNQPQSIRRPHPPILIGGGGERKTLRLVAQYAQACNLFATPELEHKLDVLRRHCEDVGRDYDDIEKTVMAPLDPGAQGEKVDDLLQELERFHKLGVSEVHGRFPDMQDLKRIDILGERVIPVAAAF
jgi:F420-dependent oxidoreductase-like protein